MYGSNVENLPDFSPVSFILEVAQNAGRRDNGASPSSSSGGGDREAGGSHTKETASVLSAAQKRAMKNTDTTNPLLADGPTASEQVGRHS